MRGWVSGAERWDNKGEKDFKNDFGFSELYCDTYYVYVMFTFLNMRLFSEKKSSCTALEMLLLVLLFSDIPFLKDGLKLPGFL